MKICQHQQAFHFELLFPYLFSFVEIGWSYTTRWPSRNAANGDVYRCKRAQKTIRLESN